MRGRVIPWLNLTSGLTVALAAAKIGTSRHIFDLDSCATQAPARVDEKVPYRRYFRRSRELIKSHIKHFIAGRVCCDFVWDMKWNILYYYVASLSDSSLRTNMEMRKTDGAVCPPRLLPAPPHHKLRNKTRIWRDALYCLGTFYFWLRKMFGENTLQQKPHWGEGKS